MPTSRFPFALLLGALAFTGVLSITSGAGPGLDPDSMSYVHAATTLAQRGTLRDVQRDWRSADSTMPLAHWPPGYPAAIATAERVGFDGIQGARFVNALAALLSIATLVWLVARETGAGAGVVAGLLVMLTPAVVQVHESVLSEPLFIALLALTLCAMVRAPERPLIAGLAAGVASLVRYAGISLAGGVVLWSLVRAGTVRQRVARATLAALPTVLLQGAWVLRTVHGAGPRAIRQLSVYGEIASTLREGWRTTSAWLVPGAGGAWGIIAVVVVAGLLVLASHEPSRVGASRRAAKAALLLAGCYLALVLASRIIADPGIPLDDRMMAPLLVLLEIALVLMVAPAWQSWPRALRVMVALAIVLWCAAAARVSVTSARYAASTGNDFAEDCWRDSPIAAWVRAHGAGRALYSNAPEELYFHSGRLAHELPKELDSATAHAFADTLARRHALVVAFDATCGAVKTADAYLPRLPLRRVAELPTGQVFEALPSASAPHAWAPGAPR